MGALALPASGTVYADAQVIIYSVERHPAYAPLLRPLWAAVQAGHLDVACSELAILEVLVVPLRNNDALLVADYDQFFAQPGVNLLPVTRSVLRAAAKLRASTRLRTPDALHAATALSAGCSAFVTNDKAFRGVSGLPLQMLDNVLAP